MRAHALSRDDGRGEMQVWNRARRLGI